MGSTRVLPRTLRFFPSCLVRKPLHRNLGSSSSARDLLISRFEESFPSEGAPTLRTIGREAEYPVVWPDGSAADVRLLLAEMGASSNRFQPVHEGGFDQLLSTNDTTQLVGLLGVDTTYHLEVGWGTLEIITGPCKNLFDLRHVHEQAMARVVASANKLGMRVLGYGIQPRTSPSINLMSPRVRYRVMLEAIGEPWNWFTVTASDQVHVDIGRSEIFSIVDMCNLLTPVVVALCGNSPIYSGKPSEFCCAREGLMRECGANSFRHGMPHNAFENTAGFMDNVLDMPFLMQPLEDTGAWTLVPHGTRFRDHLETDTSSGDGWLAFLAHEHYVWHSARARAKQSTVEMRSACQQPWDTHMSAVTLQLGIVEAAPELAALVDRTFDGDSEAAWRTMHSWHRQEGYNSLVENILKAGQARDSKRLHQLLDEASRPEEGRSIPRRDIVALSVAATIGDEGGLRRVLSSNSIGAAAHTELDALRFTRDVLDACSLGLERRGCGEERLLQPLYDRLDRCSNPAQDALDAATEGMKALLDHTEPFQISLLPRAWL